MFTTTYILSQLFIIINYIFLVITYQLKNRKKILIFNNLAIIFTLLSFYLLNGFSAVAVSIISLVRNLLFMFADKKNNKKLDLSILILIIILTIISGIYTFEGFWSLMPVIAAILYTFSIWQKNTKIFRLLGILVSILWILYDIYVFSIFAVILESTVLISSVIGYFRELKSSTI